MTRCEIEGRVTVYKLTENGELPTRGQAISTAKRRSAGKMSQTKAAIIDKDEEAVYVAAWKKGDLG